MWLAALVDGEGSISVHRQREPGGEAYYVSYTLRLRVTNTHRGLLETIKTRFGGNVSSHGAAWGGRKQAYEWYILNARAEEIIRLIRPHLVVKQAQANIALQLRETYGGYRPHTGKPAPEEQVVAREGLRQSLVALNRGQ